LSIPFYDFPSSPILIIGALGIAVAIAVFFVSYKKYFIKLNQQIQNMVIKIQQFQVIVGDIGLVLFTAQEHTIGIDHLQQTDQ